MWKQKKCSNSFWSVFGKFFMVGISSKGTSDILRVFDLTSYFSRSQRSKFVHAHLNRRRVRNNSIDIWPGLLIFGVWVGHGVEQFPIENQPDAILAFNYNSFQFLYSPYPSPGAQSPSKCFTRCSLLAGGIQWCACTHCSARCDRNRPKIQINIFGKWLTGFASHETLQRKSGQCLLAASRHYSQTAYEILVILLWGYFIVLSLSCRFMK
jgi:hypothetical protein